MKVIAACAWLSLLCGAYPPEAKKPRAQEAMKFDEFVVHDWRIQPAQHTGAGV